MQLPSEKVFGVRQVDSTLMKMGSSLQTMLYLYIYDIQGTAVLVNLAEDHHHCPAQTRH